MQTYRFGVLSALLSLAVLGLVPVGPAASASPAQPAVVNAVPATTTPNIADGAVLAIAQVGNRVVLGGNFTSASPPDPRPPTTTETHPYLLAFDPATGTIDPAFMPGLDGAVNALQPGPTADTVYVAGDFRTVNGIAARGVTLLKLTDGSTVGGFASPVLDIGTVNDIAVRAGRLFLAGTFTKVNGAARAGLATLNATTGTLDAYLTVQVAGHHNWATGSTGAFAPVGVSKIDISPDGTRLVAIGNFKNANGLLRDQIAMIDLGLSTVVDTAWRTARYSAVCWASAFEAMSVTSTSPRMVPTSWSRRPAARATWGACATRRRASRPLQREPTCGKPGWTSPVATPCSR